MIWHKCLLVLVMLLVSGCSFLSDDDDEPEEIVAPLVELGPQSINLEKIWSRNVGDMGDDAFTLVLTPAIDGEQIYTTSAEGRVMSVVKNTGEVNWVENIDKPVTSAVGAGSGLVIVADREGGVYALNSADGSLRWRAQASSEVLAAPVTDGDVVIVQAVDSRVQAFDAKNGDPRWVYSASQAVLSLRGNAAPVLRDNFVYVAFDNGKAAALNAHTGLLEWEQRFIVPDGRSELERVIDVQADPVVVGAELFIGTYQGVVASLDREQGQPHWEEKASVSRAMAENGGSLFFVESNDAVRSLRIATGREAWKSELFTGRKLSGVAVIDDYLAVADKEGYVHLLNQADGTYSGRYPVGGGGVRANLLSDGIVVFVLANNGKLVALRIGK